MKPKRSDRRIIAVFKRAKKDLLHRSFGSVVYAYLITGLAVHVGKSSMDALRAWSAASEGGHAPSLLGKER